MHKMSLRSADKRGFTLVEVMMGGLVLVTLFITALGALQQGFSMLDTARNTTLAAQVIQSEIEDLRLQPWAKISDPDIISDSGPIDLKDSIGKYLDEAEGEALAARLSATRTIVDVPDRASNLKRVTITVSWSDYLGRHHTRSYETLLGHFGLSDYFVASHSATP